MRVRWQTAAAVILILLGLGGLIWLVRGGSPAGSSGSLAGGLAPPAAHPPPAPPPPQLHHPPPPPPPAAHRCRPFRSRRAASPGAMPPAACSGICGRPPWRRVRG